MNQENRIKKLNNFNLNINGNFILYYMNLTQREDFNYSLEFGIDLSNKYQKPLIVYFPITDYFKFSNLRYYQFMIEGIIKTKKAIEQRGIKFIIEKLDYPPYKKILEKSEKCFAIILDKGYLKYQRKINEIIAQKSKTAVFEVENDVIVPVEIASSKKEPYAMTIRPKIYKNLNIFLKPIQKNELKIKSINNDFEFNELNFNKPEEYLQILNIDKSVKPSKYFKGGEDEANKFLKIFIEQKLHKYKDLRSDPSLDYQSNLSPYLHFGQISPLKIVLEILKNYSINDPNVQSFFNELIIWRELARNFAYYNKNYNEYEGIPEWAKNTLEEHKKDKREYLYSLEEFENAKTHDKYWNAAQIEMVKTGKMHNYMRMYWCKKIIEWTKNPKEAFDIACYLNDKYELDGRDPNGYAGISWCFGSFDRPWQERKIFGKIRYMNAEGLKRKFDIDKYVEKINLKQY